MQIGSSATEVTKAGGGALNPGEAGPARQWNRAASLKNGGKISISKEMGGDPVVLCRQRIRKGLTSHLCPPGEAQV